MHNYQMLASISVANSSSSTSAYYPDQILTQINMVYVHLTDKTTYSDQNVNDSCTLRIMLIRSDRQHGYMKL